MPSREFYLNDDDKSKEIREKYVKHVAQMLELSGESKEKRRRMPHQCWRWRRHWRRRRWTSWCGAIQRT